MNLNHPLEIATITSEIFANYIYDCILELGNSEIENFTDVDLIDSYIDNTIDLCGTDDFYINILHSHYGLNHNYGKDYFDSAEDLKDYVIEANLFLVNDSFAVDDVSNNNHVCQLVLEMLESNSVESV